jgi:hypothetical protein
VSLPWRKVLRVQVERRGLRTSVQRGGWLARQAVLCQAEGPAPGIDGLAAALEPLLAELEQQVDLRGASAQVEFGDAWVTLDVVEGEFAGLNERQLQAIATACIAELLGAASLQHELRWQLQRDEQHLLICAVQRKALEALTQSLQNHGVSLHSVQPHFCATWNRQARALADGPTVLAVVDGAGAAIACARSGIITSVGRATSTVEGLASLLDPQVDRLLASLGLNDDATRYLLVGAEPAQHLLAPRWTVLRDETWSRA